MAELPTYGKRRFATRQRGGGGSPPPPSRGRAREVTPRRLDPQQLPLHIDALYRAAWALCGSRHDAEDLVQETFATVLKRPRMLRTDNDLAYLLRALRNVYINHYRAASTRPVFCPLDEDDAPTAEASAFIGHEVMAAIASVPAPYRDAVIAVDVIGMSYREAARSLRTHEATITSRLHRGRQQVARLLRPEPAAVRASSKPMASGPIAARACAAVSTA